MAASSKALAGRGCAGSSWVSVAVNLGLTGVHSQSDLSADFVVLLATRHSKKAADEHHPYGRDGAALPLEARILRVADIFQAMVQDRPYRKGLSPASVRDFMHQQTERGSLDAAISEVLLTNLDDMIRIARQAPEGLPA